MIFIGHIESIVLEIGLLYTLLSLTYINFNKFSRLKYAWQGEDDLFYRKEGQLNCEDLWFPGWSICIYMVKQTNKTKKWLWLCINIWWGIWRKLWQWYRNWKRRWWWFYTTLQPLSMCLGLGGVEKKEEIRYYWFL